MNVLKINISVMDRPVMLRNSLYSSSLTFVFKLMIIYFKTASMVVMNRLVAAIKQQNPHQVAKVMIVSLCQRTAVHQNSIDAV